MSVVYMMVGLPYSGKTTYIKSNDNLKRIPVVSSDAIIHEMASADGTSYNKDFKKYYKKAKTKMREAIKAFMNEKECFIFDRTNLTKKSRASWIKLFKENGYKVTAFVFNKLPYSEITERIKSRPEQLILERVYNDMLKKFEMPTVSEGFDDVCVIR